MSRSRRAARMGAGASALALLASGCSLAPKYERPATPTTAAFKEATAEPAGPASGESWKVATPSDQIPRGEWWTIFGDTTLDELERQASTANQDVKAAAARVEQARAIQREARAGLFPSLGIGVGATREKDSPAYQGLPQDTEVPARTMLRAQAGASYEADLFGRVQSGLAAARADAQGSEALLASVQLALQADIAQTYFRIRAFDAEIALLERTMALRGDALSFVETRFREGEISELDVARARAELATAKSDSMAVSRSRAAGEHALAVLLGQAPSALSIPGSPLQPVRIAIPAGLPSTLLERRPDIAAAERAVMAANARIGVARAAFFPSLSLTGSGGFESSTIGDLFDWGSRSFLLGPLVGTALNLPIFDGGRRNARLTRSRAELDEQAAKYRQQVLTAFRETEDSLSDLRIIKDQTGVQDDAVAASSRASHIARSQYREGAVAYLDVIDAERTLLQAQRTSVQLAGLQATATVNLVRALGGGWGEDGGSQRTASSESSGSAVRGSEKRTKAKD